MQIKGQAKRAAQRWLAGAAGAAAGGAAPQRVLDQAVAASLAQLPLSDVQDIVGLTRFLHHAYGPLAFEVHTMREPAGSDHDALRWHTLLDALAAQVPPLPVGCATRVGLAHDRLLADATPFVRPRWVADVGMHAGLSSSTVATGRLLWLLIRICRPAQVVEIGTAYGLGSLYVAEALRAAGSGFLRTLEISQPQLEVAERVLADYTDVVRVHGGQPATLLHEVVAEVGQVQLVFHDGEHSGDAYERDFGTLVDRIDPGGIFLLDDIRWNDGRVTEHDPDTYRGWQNIASHPRVRAAAEIGGRQGLLLL